MEVMVMVVAEMDVSCRGPKMKVDTEPSGDFATNSVGYMILTLRLAMSIL